MGFALQMAQLSAALEPEIEGQVREFLRNNSIEFNDDVIVEAFDDPCLEIIEPGIEVVTVGDVTSESQDPGLVATLEIGWSDWSCAQERAEKVLGNENLRAMLDIHAWAGATVPADVDSVILGKPKPRKRPHRSFLERLRLVKPSRDEIIARFAESSVCLYGGPYENFCIASTPRLLQDLEDFIAAEGFIEADPLEALESLDEEDPVSIAHSTVLLFHRFLNLAQENKHIVWWVK